MGPPFNNRLQLWTSNPCSYRTRFVNDRAIETKAEPLRTMAFSKLCRLCLSRQDSFAYDANGNLASDGLRSYTWDVSLCGACPGRRPSYPPRILVPVSDVSCQHYRPSTRDRADERTSSSSSLPRLGSLAEQLNLPELSEAKLLVLAEVAR